VFKRNVCSVNSKGLFIIMWINCNYEINIKQRLL